MSEKAIKTAENEGKVLDLLSKKSLYKNLGSLSIDIAYLKFH